MTIRVTITKPGVTDAYGIAMAVGTTYTVEENFGLSLIQQGRASDTDEFLDERINAPFDEVVYPIFPDDFSPVGLSVDGTSLVSGDGTTFRPALSGKLIACVPGRDVATRFNDITANAAHLAVEAGNSAAFSNNGYFTTTASTTGGLNIPQSKVLWNPYSESIVVSMVLKSAIPAGTAALMSIGANGGSGYQGFRLYQVVTTGYVGITGWANGGANLAQSSTSAIAVSDATPQDRVVTVAYDAPTGSWYVWRDGVLILSAVGLTIGGTGFADAVSNAELRLGASAAIAGATVAVLQGRALQFAKYVGALPTNIGVIAARLAETPGVPISGLEW